MMTRPSGAGLMKLSCFSAVMPVSGWNQWVKWVAPFSTAQAHMADATAFATERSRRCPSAMVFCRELYTSAESRAFITRSSKTLLPKISGICVMVVISFSRNEKRDIDGQRFPSETSMSLDAPMIHPRF